MEEIKGGRAEKAEGAEDFKKTNDVGRLWLLMDRS